MKLSRYHTQCPNLTKCGVSRQSLQQRQQTFVQRKTRRHTRTQHDEAYKRLSLTMRTRLKTSLPHYRPNFEQQQLKPTRTDNACLLSAGTEALCSLPTSDTTYGIPMDWPRRPPSRCYPLTPPVQFSTFYRSPSHPMTRISLATVRQAPTTGGNRQQTTVGHRAGNNIEHRFNQHPSDSFLGLSVTKTAYRGLNR